MSAKHIFLFCDFRFGRQTNVRLSQIRLKRTVVAQIILSTKTFEKRYENGSLTPFFETPLPFFETSNRVANENTVGIAV